jgi:hypothetical protein
MQVHVGASVPAQRAWPDSKQLVLVKADSLAAVILNCRDETLHASIRVLQVLQPTC